MVISYKKNQPFVEGVAINNLVKKIKTPFYLYSQKIITRTYRKLKKDLKSEIFYSVKANSNQAILILLKSLGAGADVVSKGELKRVLLAGFNPKKIIFEGVGKSKEDLIYAIDNKIRLINIESIEEINLINTIGKSRKEVINIGIRMNPEIDSNSPKKISTGKRNDKFGISIDKLNQLGFHKIVIDPGFGFGKTIEHNYQILNNLEELKTLNSPILVGTSRKSMIYNLLKTTPQEALNGTSIINTIALQNGANILRVHDVKEAIECVKITTFAKNNS